MRLFPLLLLLAFALPASADSLTLEIGLPQRTSFGSAVAFSPDGKTLFTTCSDTTHLWETATWNMRAAVPYCARSFALARDGHVVAATSSWYDPVIRVFSASTGELRNQFKSDVQVHEAQVLSPDGKLLALGRYQGLWLYDVCSGKQFPGSARFKCAVDSLAFCSDGKLLAIGDQLGEIVLWDVAAAKEIVTLDACQKRVYSLAYAADAAMLASVGGDNSIRLWDVKQRKQRLRIPVQVPVDAYFVAITRDGKRIASVSTKGTVKLWDAGDGRQLTTVSHGQRGFSIAFSPDGKRLAVRFETSVKVWKLVNGGR